MRSCDQRVRLELGGEVLADSTDALRVLETSHPPTVYVPPDDVRLALLAASPTRPTWCEFKGTARYLDAIVGDRRVRAVAWTYADPSPGYEALRDHVAFFPGRVDAARMGDERVQAQDGDFYGGWNHRRSRRSVQGTSGHARLVSTASSARLQVCGGAAALARGRRR